MKTRFIFSTAFLGQLFLSSIPATQADNDGHGPFQLDGICFDFGTFFEEGLNQVGRVGTLLDGNETASVIVTDTMESIVMPILEAALTVALHLGALPVFGFGVGDWKASDIEGTCTGGVGTLEAFGCETIPYNTNQDYKYGIVAGLFEIDELLQTQLLFDTPPTESIFPSFCFAIKTGDNLKDFTLGMTFNDAVIITATEIGPTTNPIFFLVSLLAEIGVESVSMGISAGDGLQVPVKYFNDGKWKDSDFYPSFYMSFIGGIDLPFLPESFSDFIVVEGTFTRSFSFTDAINVLDDIFSSSVNDLDISFLSSTIQKLALFPEAMSITTEVAFDLTEITMGLLQGLNLGEMDLNMYKVPEDTNDAKAGIYLRAEVEATFLNDIKNKVCKELDGVLKAVAGAGCKSLDFEFKADFGIAITLTELQLDMSLPGFEFSCRVSGIGGRKTKLKCDIDGVLFDVIADAAGFVIGKLEDIGGEAVEEVADVAKDAVRITKGLGREVGAVAKLGSKASEKLFQSVAKFFKNLGDVGGSRQTMEFNFRTRTECRGTLQELFSTYSVNDEFLSQSGNDQSRSSCFTACYLAYFDNKDAYSITPCCEYKKSNSGDERICSIGAEGRMANDQSRISASITFVEDFEGIENLKEAGASCSKDADCFSGLCDDGYCKVDCDPDNKCYPKSVQAFQKCNQDDDSCLNVEGEYHYCHLTSDTCMPCGGMPDTSFGRANLGQGTYTFQSSGTGNYWHMQGDGSNHRLDGRSWDSSISNEFKFDVKFFSFDGKARNQGHNRYMHAEGGDVTGVKAKHFRSGNDDHVLQLQKLGECNRYYIGFKSGTYAYEDVGSSHNIKTTINHSDATSVIIERV